MIRLSLDTSSTRLMNRHPAIVAGLLISLASVAGCATQRGATESPASARSAAAGRTPQTPRQEVPQTDPLEGLHEAFALWDRGHKGILSADDIRVAGEQGFRTLDRNGDGHITATEMLATRIEPSIFNGANGEDDNTIEPAEYQALLARLARQAGGGDGRGVTEAQLSGSAQGRALARLLAGR